MPSMGPTSTKNSKSFFEGNPRNKTLNGLGRIKTNDKEGYQFDEILEKNYDRQVETQNIPVKTINITSHHSSPEKS